MSSLFRCFVVGQRQCGICPMEGSRPACIGPASPCESRRNEQLAGLIWLYRAACDMHLPERGRRGAAPARYPAMTLMLQLHRAIRKPNPPGNLQVAATGCPQHLHSSGPIVHSVASTNKFSKTPAAKKETSRQTNRGPSTNRPPILSLSLSRERSAASTMLLRLRSPDGMFRLTVEQDGTFGDLITQVPSGPCLGVPGSRG